MYQVKDFIETAEGLLFAVVDSDLESGRVLAYLRYALLDGRWQKLHSEDANNLLQAKASGYLWHSVVLDAELHAVPSDHIVRHYHPRLVLADLLLTPTDDPVLVDLQTLCQLLENKGMTIDHLGVTGSCLLGLQQHNSDIDLVCYKREDFQLLRQIVEQLILEDHCQHLNANDWMEAFRRRGCVDLSLDAYIWHEQRKFNKAMLNNRKFDISLVTPVSASYRRFAKLGHVKLTARVTDAEGGFDYPACFAIDHPDIQEVVSYTATYNGQAQAGEIIEVAGQLEVDSEAKQRLVVGSSREAIGEYIRVVGV